MKKKNLFWLSLFFLGLFTTIPKLSIAQMECSTPDSPPPPNFTGTTGTCANLIDQDGSESFPLFTVKMAIHFIADGNGNFYDGDVNDWSNLNGTRQAINLINHSNELLSDLHDNPIQSIDFDGDSRIRFQVVPNYEDGVYFWDDLDDYVPVPGVLNALFIDKFTPPNGFHLNGLACGIDSDCNNVKQWGWQSSELLGGPWHSWNYARLLNHEVFHVLGLNHAWYSWAECSGVDIDHTLESSQWNSGSTNTMNYVNCQCALSPCQWSHIYSNCYDNHFSFTEIDCNQTPIDIVVDQDQTWDERVVVTGNVVVEDGVTLTITCDVELNSNSHFHIHPNGKLIVDGGTLTSLKQCNVDTWKGIRVYGGNSDFDVKLTNGATIENTSQAAVSMFAPEPWPQITNWGNGILQADNTTFNNTRRIVEFMSWSPLPNPSYIRDCVQNGGKWSITNWNCQGIDVSDNVFNDITNECIVTETGQFTIIGNEFNSGQSDILFNNVSAGISTLVESNQFNGSNTGYNARGTTFAQNEIRNNNFQTGSIDVMNDGHNQYNLDGNNITATFGAATFDGGGGMADVHNNDFSGNLAGALPIGNNEDYNFYENCYSTSFVDNHIVGQISPVIHSGSAFLPAHNCFTHNGNQNFSIQDLGGNPDPFTYLEATDETVDCENAILADPVVNRLSNGDKDDPVCGSSLDGDVTEWNYCWPKRWVKDDVWYAYSWLRNKLNEIDNNPNLSDEQKEWFKQIYKRCFWRVRGYLFEIYVKEGNYEDARELYIVETHEDAKVYIFSSYVLENDLESARSYLYSISSETEQMSDFITIQNINLNRLPYGPFYETSSNEIGTVRAIAMKSHPYAAYGKALYYALTGEVISSTIPDLGRGEIQPRSISSSNNKESLKVYPNPFSDELNIEIKGYKNLSISVLDFFGRSIYANTSDLSSLTIPTDRWNQGMYLITIKSDGEIILTDKILLVH